MQAEAETKKRQIARARNQQFLRLRERDFSKTHLISGHELSGSGEIDRDHVRDFRVAADGLAISKEQNRIATRRDLNGAGRDRF